MNQATTDAPIVGVDFAGHVAIVEIRRPPHNFFDIPMIQAIADAFEQLEADANCRAIVLCAQGSAFCAGANFANRDATPPQKSPRAVNPLYFEAIRLVSCTKPVVAAVHGPAIGGGMGLALAADFRVTCAEARFSVNFNRLGFHPGFGLSYTLPRLVGPQQAALLLYTGRRIGGEEALRIGLADVLAAQGEVRVKAIELADEIATSSPIAVQSTRATLRAGFVEQFRLAVAHESIEQNAHFKTEDFGEGVKAMAERRVPRFAGR
ncbi:MAG TPA: enoyl-CoA hydratase/isomerase family protein [Burkholderiaceae bacterium]|nr:enoyl-CoA hydratase/isomerase family protein [Burkholderiaceae bacterium]HRH86500.1 enoyl-CoA hydratase/isomerase family protein [Rubrivivax sp.]